MLDLTIPALMKDVAMLMTIVYADTHVTVIAKYGLLFAACFHTGKIGTSNTREKDT